MDPISVIIIAIVFFSLAIIILTYGITVLCIILAIYCYLITDAITPENYKQLNDVV
jgi:hypothetical protein